MTMMPVDVYVRYPDNTPCAVVNISVYSTTGVLYTRQVTDAAGKAEFLLESGYSYQLRFFKSSTYIKNPQIIEVLETSSNIFDVTAENLAVPVSSDPHMCMCSGRFYKSDGSPYRHLHMEIYPQFNPLLVEGNALMPGVVRVATDSNGFASVQLLRHGIYDVVLPTLLASAKNSPHEGGLERKVIVPDLQSCNLPDLLFPVFKSVLFWDVNLPTQPVTEVTLAQGAELDLNVELLTTSGLVVEDPSLQDIRWSSSNNAILGVTTKHDRLTLRGISVGAAELQAVQWDRSIVNFEHLQISGVPLTVTVQ